MGTLDSWLPNPKSLQSPLTLYPPSVNLLCSILKIYPECHHFSPLHWYPESRPSSPLTRNVVMVSSECSYVSPCPPRVYFLKNVSLITSLLCSNPPITSLFTQNYIPSLCSSDTLSVRPSPNALYNIITSPTPNIHLYKHCPQNQKLLSPATFPFPLHSIYILVYLVFVFIYLF